MNKISVANQITVLAINLFFNQHIGIHLLKEVGRSPEFSLITY
ncbi:hypothetical protein [Pleurocapsa sp. PCC 7319]|nr:hypothetical protein [Pleurocapsa sp. PCC 7319]